MSADCKSFRSKTFFKCGMRTSLRLTPNAQRKNRVVTRMSGATYRRSVMGAEVVISLSQSSIKVHVSAIHEQMLAGDVCGARRKQEDYHGRDLIGRGHSMLQRDLCQNGLKLLFRVGKCAEPPPVQRGHYLCGNNRVHADAVA